ncbi:MAG: Gfo/Idh/MocA family oxidoreductase [Dehalococcoidia bacterium]|nr:Gfo/Idh/MocA family oxidoreductase [Dehalococcoidia bacterium]MDW8120390.1 Gfo/Idh/MocA family oxidoreductase [Chloroflexota bacterium]
MTTIGWGIIGIGQHADRFIAPAISKAKGARLVAVLSRDKGRARAFADKHGAPGAYDSLPDFLRHPGLDAVFIASPNALHKEQTIACAQAGKHVLVEKPMALSVPDCWAMIEECQRRGVKLGVGFHARQHPAHQEVRRLVQNGVLGDLVLLQGQWARGTRGQKTVPPATGLRAWWSDPDLAGGGAVMGMGVHIMDLLRFVSGQEIIQVTAMTDGQSEAKPLEDLAIALLALSGGAYATLVCSRRIPDSLNNLVVYGVNGRAVSINTLGTTLTGRLEVETQQVQTTIAYTAGDMYQAEVEAFQKAILEGGDPPATGMDGLRVCQITEALFRSQREGKRIPVPPL